MRRARAESAASLVVIEGSAACGGTGASRLLEGKPKMDVDVLEIDEERPKPEPPRLQPMQRPWRTTAVSLVGLFLLAIFYTFYFARDFFLPLTLAWIFNLLLRPILNFLKRCHIPQAIAA